MKRFCLAMRALLAASFFPPGAQNKVPAIAFDALTWDFGNVIEGEALRHIFRFTNKGTATLRIFSVAPS